MQVQTAKSVSAVRNLLPGGHGKSEPEKAVFLAEVRENVSTVKSFGALLGRVAFNVWPWPSYSFFLISIFCRSGIELFPLFAVHTLLFTHSAYGSMFFHGVYWHQIMWKLAHGRIPRLPSTK